MILGYSSAKWWNIFTPDQCSGINKFVAHFTVPLLSFGLISKNDPYIMNFRFIAADTLQKIIVLTVLAIWSRTSSRGSLEWSITLFSLSTLPNTLVMGIPLLKGIGARIIIAEQFPDTTPMPSTSAKTRLILIMVCRKLIRNPNTYSSLIGFTWWNVKVPAIVHESIEILSITPFGMAMFSLGLSMALQPKIIACGKLVATLSMAVRFLIGPAVMATTSFAVGFRGALLHIAIVQAALPQGVVPFVFAKEYNVHPDILSTGVIFGMLIALPITLVYYILLGLKIN
ncbi:hypothetical protein RD792_005456 [Penstemon davidsonii]|uniref:Auxin efflux carrier component n=1 Tax=Penstemon davidsonii TaxID=160366 RepID=A0ABR0DKN3_9LAMI|nr:hypothetical protein RD792_005456 [Penstemon davidsonii]